MSRRRFGRVRRLPSGRWQARYPAPDGRTVNAPHTFRTKTDAGVWLDRTEQSVRSGDWIDPRSGRDATVRAAVEHYLATRNIADSTRREYQRYLTRFIAPDLGGLALADLRPRTVNAWTAHQRAAHPMTEQPAKAYRLLHAACALAVREQVIGRNPCQTPEAGAEHHPERTPPTVAQTIRLVAATPARHRCLLTVAAYSGLRWGELVRLERRDLLEDGTRLRVRAAKSDAGVRTVTLPGSVAAELAAHLEAWVPAGPRALIFTSPAGKPLHSSNFNRRVWQPAKDAAGVPELHFHDLRHLAGTLAAVAGATTRELMARLGHASPRAAMIYQHAAQDRDAVIAGALDDLISKGHVAGTVAGLTDENGEVDTA